MLKSPSLSNLTLSIEQLRSIAEERATALRRADEMAKKLDAARVLFGDFTIDTILQEAEGQAALEDPTASVAAVVEQLLKGKRIGVTTAELLEEVCALPIGPKVRRTPNNLYNSVSKLVERGDAVRHGKLLYSAEAYSRVSKGAWPDPRFAEAGASISPNEQAVLGALKAAGVPLTSASIVARVIRDPVMAKRHGENSNYFGALISKMVSKEMLRREKRVYLLPEWSLDDDLLSGDKAKD